MDLTIHEAPAMVGGGPRESRENCLFVRSLHEWRGNCFSVFRQRGAASAQRQAKDDDDDEEEVKVKP